MTRKELNKQYRAKKAEYKLTKDPATLLEAYILLSELGRSTRQLIKASQRQQTKLF